MNTCTLWTLPSTDWLEMLSIILVLNVPMAKLKLVYIEQCVDKTWLKYCERFMRYNKFLIPMAIKGDF